MKKLIALVIAAMMILTMIPVMAFTASADQEWNIPDPDDGSYWSTYRNPKEYMLAEGEPFNPAAGFKYTTEGFVTIAPEYSGTKTPAYTVQTSNPVDINDGFYMQFRVDDFSYKGESGSEDEWICISISDRRLVSPGATNYGKNWLCLIRGAGDGSASVESFNTTLDEEGKPGNFQHFGNSAVTASLNGDNQETYEFAIVPGADGKYNLTVNDVSVMGLDQISTHLATFEDYYIGVSFHTGQEAGTAAMTILKQGSSKNDAETPTGNASKAPEVCGGELAEIADPSTVPANEPALLFDGNLTTSYGEPSCTGCVLSKTANNTWKVNASGNSPYFVWNIRNDISYDGKDFPVFGMMLKNYVADDGGIYYCAGSVLTANNEVMTSWTQWDDNTSKFYEAGDDEYLFVTVDLTGMWEGRIHSVRPFFSVDPTDESQTEFDVDFMGFFRSTEEAFAYSDAYAAKNGGEIVTESETESETAAESDSAVDTGADTGADTGDATGTESGSAAESGTAGETTAEDEGCASVIGFSAAAIMMAAAAVVVLKKKD